jgi:hypothetical protein
VFATSVNEPDVTEAGTAHFLIGSFQLYLSVGVSLKPLKRRPDDNFSCAVFFMTSWSVHPEFGER